jgi:hypothetical protein
MGRGKRVKRGKMMEMGETEEKERNEREGTKHHVASITARKISLLY